MKRTSSSQSKLSSHFLNTRLKAIVFLLLILLIATFSGFLLYQKFFFREEIARLLPADSTLAFAELTLDPANPQVQQFQTAFLNHPYLSQTGLKQTVQNLIPDYDQVMTWSGGRIGVALISYHEHENPTPVLLIKVQDLNKAADYVNQSLQKQNLLLLDSPAYLIVSSQPEILKQIKNTASDTKSSLKQTPLYNQVYSALPQQNLAFIYFDTAKIVKTLSNNPGFLDEKLNVFQSYLPFFRLFSADGLSIYFENDANGNPQIIAQQLSLFDPAKLPSPEYFHTDYSLDHQTLNLLPAKSLLKISSSNLTDQKNKFQKLFAYRSSVQELLFSGQLEQFKQVLFNQKIDLDQDILPLFDQQFAISIDGIQKPAYSFVLQTPANYPASKVEKLILSLVNNLSAPSLVQKESFTLPDNTKGEKLTATVGGAVLETISLEGRDVQKVMLGQQAVLYFTIVDQHLFASSSQKNLEEMLTNFSVPVPSTEQKKSFFSQIDGISEYYSFDLSNILQDLNVSQYSVFLKPFSNLTIGRKMSEIGLLSVYRLQ